MSLFLVLRAIKTTEVDWGILFTHVPADGILVLGSLDVRMIVEVVEVCRPTYVLLLLELQEDVEMLVSVLVSFGHYGS